MVGIRHISFYLPKTVQTNETLEQRFSFRPGVLERKIGVLERRISAKEESTSELCLKAAATLFAETDLGPQDVDLIVLCTQNPDYKLPHTTAILQDRLGIPTHAAAFDINLGCSGYVYSLAVVQGWMNSLGAKNTLLFTCDPYTKIIDPQDRATVPIFSDAATVTWLTVDCDNSLGASVFGTDGSQHEALIIRNSGTQLSNDETPQSQHLCMNGRVIYESMMRVIPPAIRECLEKNQLEQSDIDYFVLHQASAHILNGLLRKLDIPPEKMVRNLAYLGNTVSSTIPLALQPLIAEQAPNRMRLLLCGFGVGLSWGATVVNFDSKNGEAQ